MKLTEAQQKKIKDWLTNKKAFKSNCVVCGDNTWNISDSVFQLIEFSQQGGIRIGGPIQPIVTILCNNCGNTILLNALQSGVVTPHPKGVKNDQ